MIRRCVKVGFGKTINLGNFESIRIDVEIESEIGREEKFEGVLDSLYLETKEFIEKKEQEIREEGRRRR